MEQFSQSILELIVRTSTDLPPDVRAGLAAARDREAAESRAALALGTIALNVDLAAEHRGPLCQDTGVPIFLIRAPLSADELALSEAIGEAVAQATRDGILRANAIDTLSGANSGTNLGEGMPVVQVEQWLSDDLEVRLLLRGGGCEAVSLQLSLPTDLPRLGRAERDLGGVRKCVLHAIHQAQGQGCPVGALGVAIGGDRASALEAARDQLFRPLDDINPDPRLAQLEHEVVREANALGIGAMGLGGASTLMACKVAALHHLPSTFFVSVAYSCWALRRRGVVLDGRTGAVKRWLYAEGGAPQRLAREEGLPLSGREIPLTTPLSERQVRDLRLGDVVLLSGLLHTGREPVHRYLSGHESPVPLRGAAFYHCGPVAVPTEGGGFRITAAGPTSSWAVEPWVPDLVRVFGVRAVIGKGGLGTASAWALRDCGGVYLTAIGGAGHYYAGCIEAVEGVDLLAFGLPEAMWHLRVRDFPAVVTMDARGGSLHAEVAERSARALAQFRDVLV